MRRQRSAAWGVLLCGIIAASGQAAPDTRAAGEALYLRGVLSSGGALVASRVDSQSRTRGAEAACVKCHRRSGLGAKEGTAVIPPITGRYLFHSRNAQFDEAELSYVETARLNRAAYTDVTLARAIRTGVDSDGGRLNYLMPRFDLGDADMAALIAYLKTLDRSEFPGVTPTVLHFATIITPDADPRKREGMLDVMQHYFADKNTFPFPPSPPMRSSGKTLYTKSMYMSNRHWQLHVWQLDGPASGWGAQLDHLLASEPVMAAVAGLGGSDWRPVHEFCQRAHMPCLFPNVEAPPVANEDFYTLYFSRGVLLEADLIAERLRHDDVTHPVKSVLQVFRAGDSGVAGARALSDALKGSGLLVRDVELPAGTDAQPVDRVFDAATADALVLWFRPGDLRALGDANRAPGTVYLSGLMGGLDHAPLPAAWRARTHIAYPFDLPDRSRVRVDFPLQWFAIRHIPVVAEQVQLDTYLACGILAETLSHMADTFAPDYLLERAETMIEHRVMTGPYPHLTLAEGQRFASKGGYMVRFAGDEGTRVIADQDWTIPD